MTFEEAFNEYERLKAAHKAGELDDAAFDGAVSRLQVIGKDGRRWRIGALTGDWYRAEGGAWVPDNPARPTPPPQVPPLLRLFLPGITAMACVVLVFAAVAGVALFEGPLNKAVAYALGRVTPVAAQFTSTPTRTQTATPTATATATSTATSMPLPTSTPTLTPSPTATPQPTLMAAAPDGPWLTMYGPQGLWVAPPDGSFLTQVEISPVAEHEFSLGVAPSGGHLAYIVDDGSADLELRILQMPELKLVASLQLLSKEVQDAKSSSNPPAGLAQGLRAIREQKALAWSPDGRTLAFIAMRDQPAADLYLYSLDSGDIKRMETLPSQAYAPNWSPDGRYLIFFSAGNFGKGNGFQMDGAWVLNFDEGKVRSLYDPGGQGEVIVGWKQPHTFLVYTWDDVCQATNLRLIDAETHKVSWVLQRCFTTAAQDPETGNILITMGEEVAEFCACSPSRMDPGMYYVPGGLGLPQHIRSQTFDRLTWDEGTRLFYAGSAMHWDAAFSVEGDPVSLPFEFVDTLPSVSRASGLTAWIKPGVQTGLWISQPNGTLRHIYEGFVLSPLWNPEGNTLFFFSEEQLWKAKGPDFTPQSLKKFDGPLLGSTWVPK